MELQAGRENRRYERVPSRLRCWCEAENVTVYARVVNLSEGGLFLRTNVPFPRGAQARLRLAHGPGELAAAATVVWSTSEDTKGPPGMGLKFEAMEGPVLSSLRTIIQDELRAVMES